MCVEACASDADHDAFPLVVDSDVVRGLLHRRFRNVFQNAAFGDLQRREEKRRGGRKVVRKVRAASSSEDGCDEERSLMCMWIVGV